MTKNRVLTCTFLALMSGFFSGFIGWQISLSLYNQKCQNQPWGFKQICNFSATPVAIWQGSTTGVWMGTILGAFVGGLVTRPSRE